jgi:hypothetical protein
MNAAMDASNCALGLGKTCKACGCVALARLARVRIYWLPALGLHMMTRKKT